MRACSRSPPRTRPPATRKRPRGARPRSIRQPSRTRRPRRRRGPEGATPIEPQTFRAVLEPYAISELLFYFGFTSLNALALLEGRSYLSGSLGEKLFDDGFTLWDDGLDPRNYPKAFDLEGVPKQRVLMVEDGVARDVVWDRRTAKQAGDGKVRPDTRSRAPEQVVRPDPVQPFDGRRRRCLDGRACRARRRRHLRHAPSLPGCRRSARRESSPA